MIRNLQCIFASAHWHCSLVFHNPHALMRITAYHIYHILLFCIIGHLKKQLHLSLTILASKYIFIFLFNTDNHRCVRKHIAPVSTLYVKKILLPNGRRAHTFISFPNGHPVERVCQQQQKKTKTIYEFWVRELYARTKKKLPVINLH